MPQGTGVFAGNLWGGCTIVDTNCYFGACGTTERAGAATEKPDNDFTNGTVAGLLGDAFAQARNYPRFKDNPADYSAVDAAIAKANALEKDNYKDFSAVEAAINTVVRDKNITEQDEVDAMAKAIEDAMAALVEKPTEAPTATPTATPTAAPSASPTAVPTATPTATPTAAPSASPTAAPTATPTAKPTATPTPAPKADPNNPKTGSSNLPVVFGSAALVLSGGALAAVLIYKKKRHEK